MPGNFQEQLISLDQRGRWRQCLEQVPHSYWHTWECCSAVQRTSGQPTYLYCLEHDGGRVALPFSEREWQGTTDIYTPAGFSGFAANRAVPGALSHWQAFAKARGYVCGYIAQHPLFSKFMDLGDAVTVNDTFYFDLTRGRAALLKRMRPNRRNAIWRWQSSGRQFLRDRHALSAFLVREHSNFMRLANASAGSFYSRETLADICADPAAELVGVADAQGVCAVCLFTSTAWGAEAVFNVAVREGRDFAVPLIWWGVEHYLERTLPVLHLGGGIRKGDELAKAKLRYGTDTAAFKSLKQVYDGPEFERLCMAANRDALPDSGYFPPYRAGGRQVATSHGAVTPPDFQAS